ncbi:MAG: hypothetical protein LBR30_05710 [Clostridioides sp.]|nr:hypothetical protein [Clostridioides sp.]
MAGVNKSIEEFSDPNNNAMKNDEEKKKKRMFLWIILALIMLIVGIWFVKNPSSLPEPVKNAINLDPNQGAKVDRVEEKAEQKGIQIPGYPEIPLKPDQNKMYVALTNPEGNPCYFEFTIKLKSTGEVIYKSGDVAPGKTINEQTLSKTFKEGTYDAVIEIRTKALEEPHGAMNGANVETKLVVK